MSLRKLVLSAQCGCELVFSGEYLGLHSPSICICICICRRCICICRRGHGPALPPGSGGRRPDPGLQGGGGGQNCGHLHVACFVLGCCEKSQAKLILNLWNRFFYQIFVIKRWPHFETDYIHSNLIQFRSARKPPCTNDGY